MNQLIAIFLMLLLGSLFLGAGLTKIVKYGRWQYSLRVMLSLHQGMRAHLLGIAIPALELASVILLVFPSTRYAGILMILGLLFIFTATVVSINKRRSSTDCNCVGSYIKAKTQRAFLIRNFILAILACLALFAV